MCRGVSSIAMRTKHWPTAIHIPNYPGVAKHERRSMFREAMKIAKNSETFDKDVVILYNRFYDNLKIHWLEIHQIENDAIVAGKSRAEALAASNEYVQTVLTGKDS
jgi:hypothetical protein